MANIKLLDITKTIKKKTVLDNINLEMHAGTVTGFNGINGSGKTMLMRMITGLIRPTSGSVYIDDKELHKDISFPPSVGALLENPAFIDGYTGKENLKLLAGIKGLVTDDEIDEILDFVGLSNAKDKKYKKYSLGMKQRLGIAAAVMEKPEIVILDEPTNSLDSEGVEMVKSLVQREKERQSLVIIACHEYEILKSLSDIIYSIEDGKIIDVVETGEL
jgi:ABC-2 type transport system ATP-binding protein